MATIQLTAVEASLRAPAGILARAAVAAARAPSLVAGQPWRWQITGDTAELSADQPGSGTADRETRLLTLSCGAALHHARTALAGDGVAVEVTRCPDPARPDVLARLRVCGVADADPAAVRLHRAIALRATERRPDAPVDADVVARLRVAAEAEGAHLSVAGPDDRTGWYAVLSVDAESVPAWLAAGEALSAVLLTATMERLAVEPFDGTVDLPGAGHPVLTLRLGSPAASPLPR